MEGIVIDANFWAEMEEGPSDVEEFPVKDLTSNFCPHAEGLHC
jgi:hypothetical protein